MAERQGVATLVAALRVRRLATVGFGFGVAFAVGVFVLFVALPGSTRPAPLYAALAFVLAVTVGLLATAVLVAVAAVRTARRLDGPPGPDDL